MPTLYEFALSPFVQKVKIALREKGVAFERCNAFAPEHRAELERLSARAEVPLFVDGDTAISDSTIILDYIDERWPDPSLMPERPAARAETRMLEELCDTELEAVNFCMAEVFFIPCGEDDAVQAVLEFGRSGIKHLHAELEGRLGDREFFGGDAVSRGDIAVLPHLNAARVMKNGPVSETLLAWMDRMNARQSVAETVAEVKEGLALFKKLIEEVKGGDAKRQIRDSRLDWLIRAGGAPILMQRLKAGNVRFSQI